MRIVLVNGEKYYLLSMSEYESFSKGKTTWVPRKYLSDKFGISYGYSFGLPYFLPNFGDCKRNGKRLDKLECDVWAKKSLNERKKEYDDYIKEDIV